MRAGFTLLESTVAISLLSIIVLFVLTIVPGSVVSTYNASERVDAENLAQSIIEETRAQSFSALTVGTQAMPSPDTRFTVQREIYSPAGTDADQTLGVRVTVDWQSKATSLQIQREVWLSSVRN